jgi:hypothetical protein
MENNPSEKPAIRRKAPLLLKIVFALVAIVVVFVIIVATRPPDYHVTRSIIVAVPPAAAFAQVNDFHNWNGWSPWAKIDPSMAQTYEGAPSGTGAIYAWTGNNKVGQGRMTITDSRTNELVRINLEFIKPFPSTAVTEFTFKPENNQTSITWTMTGKHTFTSKAMDLVVGMDKMIGPAFEQGLNQLKTVSEATSKK